MAFLLRELMTLGKCIFSINNAVESRLKADQKGNILATAKFVKKKNIYATRVRYRDQTIPRKRNLHRDISVMNYPLKRAIPLLNYRIMRPTR